MFIRVTKTDCENIVNKSLHGGGNTELEVALARHALELHESLHKAKCEKAEARAKRQELFDAVYSVYCRLMKSAGEELTAKHKAVLAGNSKAAFARAVRLDGELKELLYGTDQDSGRTGTA